MENCGPRANDKAHVGMIEIMGNELQEVARNRTEVEKEAYNLETFWQWESKICEQEVDHYELKLRELKSEIDDEILERLAAEGLEDVDESLTKKQLTPEQKKARSIIAKVEDKYADKKQFLVRGYERAKFEEQVHFRQKDFRKYERLFEAYAYPINIVKFGREDSEHFIAEARENQDDFSMTKV